MSSVGQTVKYDTGNGSAARTRPFSYEEIKLGRKTIDLVSEAGCCAMRSADNKDDIESREDDHGKHCDAEGMNSSSKDLLKTQITFEDGPLKYKSHEKHRTRTDMSLKTLSEKAEAKHHKVEKSSERRKYDEQAKNLVSKFEDKQSSSRAAKDKSRDRDRDYERDERKESKRKHRSGGNESKDSKESDDKRHASAGVKAGTTLERGGKHGSFNTSYDSHYGEVRLKRRRSQSRERYRRGTSPSASPREHKRSSFREKEDKECSYQREKEDKEHPSHRGKEDKDSSHYSSKSRLEIHKSNHYNNKKSSNGSSSSYRRYGPHSSGLGGYSPRKRRSEAAVKTPSPTNRSPERKSAAWDLKPVDIEAPKSRHAINGQHPVSLTSESKPSAHRIPTVMNLHSSTSPNMTLPEQISISVESIQLTQATRSSRRLYADNVHPSATDRVLLDYINKFLLSSGTHHLKGVQPCISSVINKEKHQALLEFLTPEYATKALTLDGNSVLGSLLTIRRPKDFVQITTGITDKPGIITHEISSVVEDSEHKVFVGGLSKALSSDMVREIVSAFGVLKAYHFEDNRELNFACAYMEYVDPSVTMKACAGLNGMKLAGHVITAVQALPNSSRQVLCSDDPFHGIPSHAKPLLEEPTHVLKLINVFLEEDFPLLSETEIEETLEDIRLECLRFGTVKSVRVVRKEFSSLSVEGLDHLEFGCSMEPEQKATEFSENSAAVDECGDAYSAKVVEETNICEELHASQGDVVVESEAGSVNDDDTVVKENHADGTNGQLSIVGVDPMEADANNLGAGEGELLTNDNPSDIENGAVVHVELSSNNEPPPFDNSETATVTPSSATDIIDYVAAGTSSLVSRAQESYEIEDQVLEIETSRQGDVNRNEMPLDLTDCPETQLDIFEPGSVLVEFTRNEGACIAAHSLHGRVYGESAVSVAYVPLHLYEARFSRR